MSWTSEQGVQELLLARNEERAEAEHTQRDERPGATTSSPYRANKAGLANPCDESMTDDRRTVFIREKMGRV